jgi:bla regulator protein blaR1
MNGLLQLALSNALAAAFLAAVVAVPAWLLRRRRPAVVHALWLVVLLKLVTPPLWTVPVAWPQRATEQKAPVVETAEADVQTVFVSAEEWDALLSAQPRPAPAPPPIDRAKVATVAAAAGWAAGALVCLALIVTRSLRFRRLLVHAQPVPPEVRRRAGTIARRFGLAGCPAVVFVPGAVCPMLWAFLGSARLLLPRGLWERLDDDQRDTLIAHELAHLRRRDHWVRLVEVAATVLYWWHPVLWLARRQLRDAEEQCCDAWVVWSMPTGIRHYMSAILEAVEFVSEPNRGGANAPPAVPMLASGMGEFRRLERRLWMIRANRSPRRLGGMGLMAVLLSAGAALPLAPSLAQEDVAKVEEPRNADDVKVEQRELILTPTVDPVAGKATITFSDEGGLVVSGSPDVRNPGVAQNTPTAVYDARTGSRVEYHGGEVRIVRGDDVDQARAEVEQLSAALAQAKARLKDLEKRDKEKDKSDKAGGKQAKGGRDPSPHTVFVPRRVEGKRFDMRLDTKTDAANHRADKGGGDRDQERRLELLEQKLEKLDAVLDELREMRKDRGREDDQPKGPGKN